MPRNPGLSQITNLIKYISLIFGAILQYVGYIHDNGKYHTISMIISMLNLIFAKNIKINKKNWQCFTTPPILIVCFSFLLVLCV